MNRSSVVVVVLLAGFIVLARLILACSDERPLTQDPRKRGMLLDVASQVVRAPAPTAEPAPAVQLRHAAFRTAMGKASHGRKHVQTRKKHQTARPHKGHAPKHGRALKPRRGSKHAA